MGRAAQKTLLSLLCLAAAVCQAQDTCPEVSLVGFNSTDQLSMLQGCSGIPGAKGSRGDPGNAGTRGQWGPQGIPGKEGQTGPNGERGPAGPSGQKGDKGALGATGAPGTVVEEDLKDKQCKKGAKNCKELLATGNIMSGWYTIYPHDCKAMTVLCDMDTDGGGWIVFQRRVDGSVDFYRDWNSYKRGFGSRLSEFWLGNENIHLLSFLGPNELRIDLRDFDNNHEFATFSSFKVAGETEKYTLIIGPFVTGTAVVRVVGLNSTEKLIILQGCPGIPGAVGPRGDQGTAGNTGQRGPQGIPGKAGKSGRKGQRGAGGPPGMKGGKGDVGDPGPPGTPGEEVLEKMQCTKGAKNCKELLARGNSLSDWYTIYPRDCNPMTVLCDMDTDGGGWIVFQRRVDGSMDFLRDWNSYKSGFGSRLSEFWLGNDNIHLLSFLGANELRVDLRDFDTNYQFATYRSFKIAGETEKYKLILGAFVNGTAGDSLTEHNGMMFTTRDRDNDLSITNCAIAFKGAWWYRDCHMSNLNGLYLSGAHESYGAGVSWSSAKGQLYSYWWSEMKIRPV